MNEIEVLVVVSHRHSKADSEWLINTFKDVGASFAYPSAGNVLTSSTVINC